MDDKGRDGVGKIVPDPITHDCDPSARVIEEVEGCDRKVENRLELPVM